MAWSYLIDVKLMMVSIKLFSKLNLSKNFMFIMNVQYIYRLLSITAKYNVHSYYRYMGMQGRNGYSLLQELG